MTSTVVVNRFRKEIALTWSILRVRPQMERRVRDTLTDAGIPALVPEERYRPTNHWRPRTRPLMPGYIFVQLVDDHALDIARANHAVREVMCRDGAPVRLPALLIGSMILLEACHAFDRTWRPPTARRSKRRGKRGPTFESRWVGGQRVKVISGPFDGFVGEVLRIDRADRIEVLLTVFGRETAVELGDLALEAA